jgi:hypothetical protein
MYIHETGKADFVDGKMIFLQGSPVLEENNEIWSIIRNCSSFYPKYLQKNRMPSWETNCIEDWETIDAIVEETDENMTIISEFFFGCKCFERLQQKEGRPWAKYLKTLISLFMEGLISSLIEPNLKI